MNKEQVKKFYEALKTDKSMAEELKKQFEAAKPATAECAAALMVKLAAGKGYAFTVEDLRAVADETRLLDRDELDKIHAAGGAGFGPTCWGALWI